jgi:hypothetical protein
MTILIRWGLANALAVLFLLLTLTSQAQTTEQKPQNELSKALSLEGNLYLLNMWGEQPSHIGELYRLAYEILERIRTVPMQR